MTPQQGGRAAIVVFIFSLLACFYLLTLRQGHSWGDDFSMYIYHAANLANGAPYADTGYIYNPSRPELGPRTYPPIFPLLLAPVYSLFGLNLTALKVEVSLFLLAALAVVFVTFQERLSFSARCGMVLLLGLNPIFWESKDLINSDIPFVCFIYLSLYAIDKSYPIEGVPKLALAIPVGVLLYLACGIRTAGLALAPALLLSDWIRIRRPTAFAVIAVAVCGASIVLQNTLIPPDSSYLDNVKPPSAILLLTNARLYISALSEYFSNGFSRPAALALFALSSGLFLWGYATRLLERISIFEIFPIFYFVLLLVWPLNQGARLLLPVAPLYVYYVFAGIGALRRHAPARVSVALAGALAAGVGVSYLGVYSQSNFGPNRDGVGTPAFLELTRFIRTQTVPADRFIFRKPRALSLFGLRSAAIYSEPQDLAELWSYIDSIGATYIVVGEVFEEDRRYLQPFVIRFQDRLEPVYSNTDFRAYRVRRPYLSPTGSPAPERLR